jgi:pheromone shutdown protein TraB
VQVTQENRAAIMFAQTCLRRIALQLERDLGTGPASEMAEAIGAAVRPGAARAAYRNIRSVFATAPATRPDFSTLLQLYTLIFINVTK